EKVPDDPYDASTSTACEPLNRATRSPIAALRSAAAATRTRARGGRRSIDWRHPAAASSAAAADAATNRFTMTAHFNMIRAESLNGTGHVADREAGRRAARRRLLDAETVDLSGPRPHEDDDGRPPPDRGYRGRSAARAIDRGRAHGRPRTDRRDRLDQRTQSAARLRRRGARGRPARAGAAADRRPDAHRRHHARCRRGAEAAPRRRGARDREVDRSDGGARGRAAASSPQPSRRSLTPQLAIDYPFGSMFRVRHRARHHHRLLAAERA